tara:strand:+ start:30 stop:578 length:549 start_codon:yes stop_codon:yes gene_type:complete
MSDAFLSKIESMMIDGHIYILPIDELDGINVRVELRHWTYLDDNKNKVFKYNLRIYLQDFYSDEDYDNSYELHNSMAFHSVAEVWRYTVIFLENCFVDKKGGELVSKRPENNILDEMIEIFSKNQRLKLTYDECSVCKDGFTSTKTNCGHCVCIVCLSKLKRDEDHYVQCPCCRESFNIIRS